MAKRNDRTLPRPSSLSHAVLADVGAAMYYFEVPVQIAASGNLVVHLTLQMRPDLAPAPLEEETVDAHGD